MLKKTLMTAAAALAITAGATTLSTPDANAGGRINPMSLNGSSINGWHNGIAINGWSNGIAINGWTNGIAINGWTNGIAINGWRNGIAINGWTNGNAINGGIWNGYTVNGTTLNGAEMRPGTLTIVDIKLPDGTAFPR